MFKKIYLALLILSVENLLFSTQSDGGSFLSIRSPFQNVSAPLPLEIQERRNALIAKAVDLMNEKIDPKSKELGNLCNLIIIFPEASNTLIQLLEYGVAPNFCDVYPLLISAIQGRALENLKTLLRYGAQVNLTCPYNFNGTLLEIALNFNTELNQVDIEIIKCLLEHKADPNVQDKWGNTVLMNIVQRYSDSDYCMQLIDLLIRYEANCKIKNHEGKTVIDIACEKGLNDLVAFIATYYRNPESLSDLCLNFIVNNQEQLEERSFDILPLELKEKINERVPGFIKLDEVD